MNDEDLKPVEERPGRGRLAVALATLLLLAASVALLADRLLMPGAFDISEIRVRGVGTHVDATRVRQRIAEEVTGNFFSVDIEEVERVVRAMPWIATVRVRRMWPTSLEVIVDEAVPVVRWNDDDWLDQRGERIVVDDASALGPLPSLRGPEEHRRDVLEHWRSFAAMLDDERLRIRGVGLGVRGSWTVTVSSRLEDGSEAAFDIVVGREDVESRFRRFAAVNRQSPIDGLARIAQVDLRYPSGFAVRWKDGKAADGTAAAGAVATRPRQDS
jgi:cell division protein FtsQ